MVPNLLGMLTDNPNLLGMATHLLSDDFWTLGTDSWTEQSGKESYVLLES